MPFIYSLFYLLAFDLFMLIFLFYSLVALTSYKGSQTNIELTPILSVGIFVGILVAIVCIGIGTIAALKLRSHKQQQKYQHQNQRFSRPDNLQIKDKSSLPLSHTDTDTRYDEKKNDEKNPDVVPYKDGNVYNT